jgi:hypothetical protein
VLLQCLERLARLSCLWCEPSRTMRLSVHDQHRRSVLTHASEQGRLQT